MAHAHELLAQSFNTNSFGPEEAPVFAKLRAKYRLFFAEVDYADTHKKLLSAMEVVAGRLWLGYKYPSCEQDSDKANEIAAAETAELRQEVERLSVIKELAASAVSAAEVVTILEVTSDSTEATPTEQQFDTLELAA